MASLTVQQRDILQVLLRRNEAATLADIAAETHLTPRQVIYRLTGVRAWVEQHGAQLDSRPGVGYAILCSAVQRHALLKELQGGSPFSLVLNAGQRAQLLAFAVLTLEKPLILKQIQPWLDVSRATALKDLNLIESWLARFDLHLEGRPHYGFLVQGEELNRRQALVALLWGDMPFSSPLLKVTYDAGLLFALAEEASLSPLVQQMHAQLQKWDVHAAFEWVAQAEVQMRGRFADNAVMHLALALAIQHERVRAGKFCTCKDEDSRWLQEQPVWEVAEYLTRLMWPEPAVVPEAEIAVIAMHLLVGIRNEEWPGEPYTTPELAALIDLLMENVAGAFFEPGLRHDLALREGLLAHIGPALMRQRFGLWTPPAVPDQEIAQECFREYKIAQTLAALVEEQVGVELSAGEIDALTLLLRAAYVRARPERRWRVFVVCPAGMATAQLLAARLKTRFPNLEILGVLSQRELSSERVRQANFLITTTPLEPLVARIPVIEVHPLLLPRDVVAISKCLNG